MSNSISIIRVIATLFIVLYHSLCYFGIWHFQSDVIFYSIDYCRSVCNVCLHTFVFISGYLFAYTIFVKGRKYSRRQYLVNKIKRLLIPYIFWSIIAIVLFQNCEFYPSLLCGTQHLWFLLMLFTLFVVIILFKNFILKLNLLQLMGGVFLIQCLYWLSVKFGLDFVNYLQWKRVLEYLPAFLAGYAMVRYNFQRVLSSMSIKTLRLIMIITVALMICMILIPNLHLSTFYYYLPAYAFLYILITVLDKQQPIFGTFVNSIDKCSMGIYIFHHLIIWLLIFYVPGAKTILINHYLMSPVIIFLISTTLSWGLTLLIKKNKFLSIIIGG